MSLHRPLAWFVVVVACGCSRHEKETVASAQAPVVSALPPLASRDPGERLGPPSPELMIARFDTNGDGQLQQTELPAPMRGKFEAADEDKNGVVTPSELKKAFQADADKLFARADTNGDQFLDASELGPRYERFQVADANGDGRLTQQEIQNAIEAGRMTLGAISVPRGEVSRPGDAH